MKFKEFITEEIGKKEEYDRLRGHRRTWEEWMWVRLGAPVAFLVLQTPMSAPQVLLVMLVTGLIGPALIGFGTQSFMVAGIVLLAVSTLTDNIDGIVFRHRGQPAVRGAFLDRFNHALIYPLTYLSFGVAAYRVSGDWRFVVAGMGAGMFRDSFETLVLYESKFIEESSGTARRVRMRDFFRSGMYRQAKFWWVSPLFVLRNATNTLAMHVVAYVTMLSAVLLHRVPELVIYFLILYAVRFFAYAGITFGVTFRDK